MLIAGAGRWKGQNVSAYDALVELKELWHGQAASIAVDCLHPAMPQSPPPPVRIELLQGTLDLLILHTLRAGPRHGYSITQSIRAGSRDALQVDTGSLYPALHRLQRKGLLKSDWGTTDNLQRARFYQLTAAGKRQLAAEQAKWSQMVDAIAGVLKSAPEGGAA